MAKQFNTQGRILLTVSGIIAGGLIVYLGVSLTAPAGPSESVLKQIPIPEVIAYGTWSDSTWARAKSRPSLVFLFVADELSRWTDSVDAALNGSEDLRAAITRRFVPIRIDRRLRPDLAERYSEGSAPFLSVLLPTGEAIIKLDGDEDAWSKQLVEADRYWRDHREELQDRAASFWEEIDSDSSHVRAFRSPTQQDLDIIRESVRSSVDSLLAQQSANAQLWRPDIQRFLYASALAEGEDSWAWQTLRRMYTHRDRFDTMLHRRPDSTPARRSRCSASWQ